MYPPYQTIGSGLYVVAAILLLCRMAAMLSVKNMSGYSQCSSSALSVVKKLEVPCFVCLFVFFIFVPLHTNTRVLL